MNNITFVRDLNTPDETRRHHARSAIAGAERRVARGAYVPDVDWQAADARARYLMQVRAVAETRRRQLVLSHWSAAAIHGLPNIVAWPSKVHVTIGRTTGGRSRADVVKHSLPLADDEAVEIDGMLVTSVARTVLDMAVATSFAQGVAMVDAALHVDRRDGTAPMTTRLILAEHWERRMPFRGNARARAAIEFGETRADTPIESVSRVTMHLIGCPKPQLQSSYFDADGFIGDVDFDWPEYGVVGEADGERKYLDAAYRSGRTAEQVLLDEKVREDRLRALPKTVSRWGWAVANSPMLLREKLTKAGLPMRSRR